MATIYHLGGYGSGKTSQALKLGIYEELINGTRGIVTNVALLKVAKKNGKTVSTEPGLGALNDLLHRRFKNLDTRVLQRVRILTEDEVPHFFCHRISRGGFHYDIPVPSPDAEKRGARPDFSLLRDDGCVFVIDEFHDYFNARLWAEVGRSVGWYKNQQRKLGDDIHACTPQIDEVDKQLRTIGHEYRVYNNLGLRKVRGIVLPQTFICSVYSSLDSVKRKGQPLNKYPFTLDIELANCYDTAKGVRGLQGGSADIGKRPKGIRWWVPVLLFALVIAGIIYMAFYARRHMFNTHKAPPPPAVQPVSPASISQSHAPATETAVVVSSNQISVSAEPQIYCVGWVQNGKIYDAYMSDGTIYSSGDGEIDWIRKRAISIQGKIYQVHPAPDLPYVPTPRSNENYGQISPPRPVNQIQIIPFGNRNQPTQLSEEPVQNEAASGFDNFPVRR